MYRQKMQCIQRKELDYLLIRFGENLKCPEKYYEDGKNQAKQIFRTLQRESRFSLKAFHIGGSFGKKTDVIEPDLDLVIIVRDCHPPLEDVLEEFEYILRWKEENLNIRYGDYKRSERSLSFHFRNGISVDLLPAANVEDHEVPTIFEKMRNNDKYAYFYSPSFVEQQIRFMKSQDSFTHSLVRLSKFWFKSLYLEESFRGGSAMMELIAVASVEKARQREDISLSASQTFMIVLNTVRNLRSTRLAFKNVDYDYQRNHQVWKRVPAVELISDNFENLFPDVVGKREILERDYFIIDPANPFQDYLEEKTESVIEKLQNFARITCTRLETIISGSGRYGNDIQGLFEPIPEGLLVSTEHGLRPPTNVLISYDVGCRRVYNKWKIWNEDVMNDRKARRVIKIIINKLLTVVHSTVKGDPANVSVSNVGKAVFNLIERSLSADIDDGFCVTQHRKYDVMLRVPYTIGGIGYAVCVITTSLNLKHLRDDIDSSLQRFGESLKCSDKFYEDGKQLAHKVFQTLHEKSKYTLASVHYGGSFGKKTDVIEPDLNLVILVNDCHPPLQNVIDHFHNILKLNEDSLQIRGDSFKKSGRCLKFSFRNGISVDLLPAPSVRDNEWAIVFMAMAKEEKFAYAYSASFVKDQISFMKSQDSFTHTLVRLSKFWFKSLYLGQRFRGGSAMMELIAVAAAERENELKTISLSRALTRVLSMAGNLDTLKLAFCHFDVDIANRYNTNGNDSENSSDLEDWEWRRVENDELDVKTFNWLWLIPRVIGKCEIFQRSRFIIDPACPFQDYLEDKSENVIRKFKEFAHTTQGRLARILSGNSRKGQGNFIQELFQSMPEDLTQENSLLLPNQYLLTCAEPCKSVYIKLKICNERVKENRKESQVVKVLKRYLITVIHSTVKGNKDVTTEDVETAVQNLIKNSFQNDMDDAPDENKHWHNDVSLRIPYVIKDEGYAVVFSMKWDYTAAIGLLIGRLLAAKLQ
ncbi:unnamed protein product [Orchesella dallaii]|uniref:2'-5'-oligoadenylate synthetase 1 domain-containing protein n=1 Tax=Orchesella dallaii TaxID=48710 RepID=A0ABP1S7J1_9HEXA